MVVTIFFFSQQVCSALLKRERVKFEMATLIIWNLLNLFISIMYATFTVIKLKFPAAPPRSR